MDIHGPSRRHSSLIIAAILAAGCAASPAATGTGPASAGQPTTAAAPTGSPTAGAIEPAHLRMLDPDDKDRPSQAAIDGFLEDTRGCVGRCDHDRIAVRRGRHHRQRARAGRHGQGRLRGGRARDGAGARLGRRGRDQRAGPRHAVPHRQRSVADRCGDRPAGAADARCAWRTHGLSASRSGPRTCATHSHGIRRRAAAARRGLQGQRASGRCRRPCKTKIMEALGATAVYDEFPEKLVAAGTIRGRGDGPGDRRLGPRWRFPDGNGRCHVLSEVHGAGRRRTRHGAGCHPPSRMRSAGPPGPARKQAVRAHHDGRGQRVRVLRRREARSCWPVRRTWRRSSEPSRPMIERMRQDAVTATAIDAIQALKAIDPCRLRGGRMCAAYRARRPRWYRSSMARQGTPSSRTGCIGLRSDETRSCWRAV